MNERTNEQMNEYNHHHHIIPQKKEEKEKRAGDLLFQSDGTVVGRARSINTIHDRTCHHHVSCQVMNACVRKGAAGVKLGVNCRRTLR